MKLTSLPNFKKLTKDEQARLKEIAKPREKAGYNVAGDLSISKRELKKANG
jgi:hypothetical protein